LAKAQGSVVPISAGTPLPPTPTAVLTPTQPPTQPPRTSTPVPVLRGVKREFDDSAVTQPNTQGPGPDPATIIGSGSLTPTLVQGQKPGATKAGVPGARPRPIKKQRVVSHGFTLPIDRPEFAASGHPTAAPLYSSFLTNGRRLLPVPLPCIPLWSLCCPDFGLLIVVFFPSLINRTYKAKREIYTRSRQYNSLLRRVCDPA
jgi:hypothetical protein